MFPALLIAPTLCEIFYPRINTGEKPWVALSESESNIIGIDHVVPRWHPFDDAKFPDELEWRTLSGPLRASTLPGRVW
jgi:hypothetical protein